MGTGMLLSGDLGFMIEGVFSFYIGDTEIWITTSHICLLIVLLVLIHDAYLLFHTTYFCGRFITHGHSIPGKNNSIRQQILY